jgi:hypothetical protein
MDNVHERNICSFPYIFGIIVCSFSWMIAGSDRGEILVALRVVVH